MKKTTQLTSNYFFNLCNQIVLSLIPLVTAPYVSRVLGAENIGRYAFVQSIASYFAMAAVLGTSLYGQRRIAQHRDEIQDRTRIFWGIVVLRLILTAIVFSIYTAAIIWHAEEKALYLAVSLEILNVCLDISWFLQGLEDFRSITFCNTIAKTIATACIFGFVKNTSDVAVYALLHGCALVGTDLLLWKIASRKMCCTNLRLLRPLSHVRPAVLLFVSQVAMQVYTVLDKTMIGVITKSDLQNGYYEQGQKLIRVLTAIVTSVGTVMASRVANLWMNQEYEKIQLLMERSFRLVYAISFPMMYGVILVATRFVPTFYGGGYEGVVSLLYILVLLLPVIASSNVIGIQYLIPTGQERLLSVSVTAGAVLNFMCNLVLIPRFMSVGAAIGSVAAEIGVTVIQLIMVRKQLDVGKFIREATRYALLGLPMFVIGQITSRFLPINLSGMVALALEGILVYVGTLVITRDKFAYDLLNGRIL